MDRYLLTATLRGDGSSRFGGNNKWGLFPSGALAWNVMNEPFFNVGAISNLKLRLGYGVTGNQEIPNDLFKEQFAIAGTSIYVLGGTVVPSVSPNNFPNPDLQWEQTSQLNIGLDFGVFDDRINGTIDLYRKLTSNLLLQFATVSPSVVSTQWANVGEVENKGFEVTLNGVIISKENFRWNANVNFSRNLNEVLSLSKGGLGRNELTDGLTSGVVSPASTATQVIRPGLPIGTFLGREFTGLDENGLETYLDEDADGKPDQVVIGDANPDFVYGFTNSFNWKRFDASFTFRGVYGNEIFNNTACEYGYPSAAPGSNILKSAINGGVSRSQAAQYSSRWIEDGSYLRLDNLTMGYNFDTPNIPFLSRARFYITGQNLFVITDYTGFDPEVRTNTQKGGTPPIGIDYLAYPMPRVFMIGASLSF
jgi:iron complex outermembrane receptor protein